MGEEAFFRGPLYPFLLSIVYRLNGGAIAGAILVQHVLGPLTCVMIYLLGREYFSRIVALTAAGIGASYWTFVYFEGEPLIVTLFLCLVVMSLWLLAVATRSGHIAAVVGAGVCLGLYLFPAMYMLGVLAFFVNARLRLPVVPVLILLAAWTACTLFVAPRARRFRAAWLPVAFALGVGLLVNGSYPAFYRDRPTHHAISWYTIGSAYLQKGQKHDALEAYSEARAAFEAHPSPHYKVIARDIYLKLGGLYYEFGDCGQVIDTLGRVGGGDARGIAATQLVGECLERTGRPRDAIRAYQAVLQAQPGNPAARESLALCYEATGDYLEAQRVREQLQR